MTIPTQLEAILAEREVCRMIALKVASECATDAACTMEAARRATAYAATRFRHFVIEPQVRLAASRFNQAHWAS